MKNKLVSESLEELFEIYGSKDLVRMQDIKTKAAGDHEKEIKLATTQAKIIKDAGKAKARAEAAEEVFGPGSDISQIFGDRAIELGGSYVSAKPSAGNLAPIKAPKEKGGSYEREHKTKFILPSERLGYSNAEEEGGGFSRGSGSITQKLGIGKFSKPPETTNEISHSPASILPIGFINFGTGESKYFNVIENNPNGNMEIWKDLNGKYKAILTSGSPSKIGLKRPFRHDQTWQPISRDGMWELVDYVSTNKLHELIRVYGNGAYGYVYK
jgi:hypothetical protein